MWGTDSGGKSGRSDRRLGARGRGGRGAAPPPAPPRTPSSPPSASVAAGAETETEIAPATPFAPAAAPPSGISSTRVETLRVWRGVWERKEKESSRKKRNGRKRFES